MKRTHDMLMTLACVAGLFCSATGQSSDAYASAGATSSPGRSGTAAATARYEGDVGFARTQTRTGPISASRAVAVGVDEDGLSLSISTALASRSGPAIALNFNFSIDRDGDVARSIGRTTSTGGISRTAAVSGGSSAGPPGVTAISRASGATSFGGVVRTDTRSEHEPRAFVVVRPVFRWP